MLKKLFLFLGLISVLTACGGGDRDSDVNTYGLNGGANQCPGRVAMSWNQNIASKCNQAMSGLQMAAAACAMGAQEFARHAGRALPCKIAVENAQWGQWGSGQWPQPNAGYFEINRFILDDIMCKHGWAIRHPNRGQCPGMGDGFPGGPGPGPHF